MLTENVNTPVQKLFRVTHEVLRNFDIEKRSHSLVMSRSNWHSKWKKKPFNIDICTHPDDKSDINIRFYDTWIQTIISRLFRRICVQQFWRRTRVFPHMAMCNKRSKVLLDHMNFQLFDHLSQQCCRLYRLLLNGPLTFREAIAIKIKNPNRPAGRRERLRARLRMRAI